MERKRGQITDGHKLSSEAAYKTENHVFPDKLLLKNLVFNWGLRMSSVCQPGLKGVYNETHLMWFSESRNALTRGNFHLSSHHCGLLISKGVCCKHILFPKCSFDNRRGLQFSLQAIRGHLAHSECIIVASGQAFDLNLSGCFLTLIE